MSREVRSGNCHILQQEAGDRNWEVAHFSADYWRDSEGFHDRVGGRGGSCVIGLDGSRAVLRRYCRGGLIGKFLDNQYLWLGKNQSRPWREWRVIEHAREAGLPVPEPIAACVCRTGLSYRASLVTAYLEDTEMLTERLQRESLDHDAWYRLGLLVKRMHAAGVRHADLTSDNVLIDTRGRYYVIDFDMARIMRRLDDWQWKPLHRFQRSIVKRNRARRLHFGESDWQALMDGYQS